ncbi:MAG: ABC transporter permease [Chitinophagaceae bacterium]
MRYNYLTPAIRNFRKNLFFSLANVASLCIGITAALIIYLVIHFEYSFNKEVQHNEQVYRVVTDIKHAERINHGAGVPPAVTYRMQHELRGAKQYAAFYKFYIPDISIENKNGNPAVFKQQPDVIFTDDHFFTFFDKHFLAGSAVAFNEPNKVVLDETRARQYFPGLQPAAIVGRTVVYNDTLSTTVTGIVQDAPLTSDISFREFVSTPTALRTNFLGIDDDDWNNYVATLFVRLDQQADAANFTRQLQALGDKNSADLGSKVIYALQPLSDLHFNADYGNYRNYTANKKTLSALALVAVFLLLLGCINFINLSTAQSAKRAKEIGVRKTMGGSRFQLTLQFLTEALLVTGIATLLAVVITPSLLRIFSDFLPSDLHFSPLQQWNILAFLFILSIVVSLLAGYYPARVLTRFQPVDVLKSQVRLAGYNSGVWLRKALIVGQFVLAQFFITATIVVVMQVNYSLQHNLEQRKDGIVLLKVPYRYYKQRSFFLQQLQGLPGVQQVGLSASAPVSPWPSLSDYTFVSKNGKQKLSAASRNADEHYLDVYQLQLLAGRNFNKSSDSLHEIMINRRLSAEMGLKDPQEAIGKKLKMGNLSQEIVGVVNDFYTQSLHTALQPLVIECYKRNQSVVNIALKQAADNTNWQQTLAGIEKIWKTTFVGETFAPAFYDEQIAALYKEEQQTATLLKWATALTIVISCLGLLGLSLYAVYQRTKEIGIRKVLGAGVMGIVQLVTGEFMKLVLLALIIAAPLAWWAANSWLQNYAYRISMSWWLFPLTGIVALSIAWLSVGFQAIKAAIAKPVDTLRSE